MTGRSKLLRIGLALFTLMNLVGGVYAVIRGEGTHAAAHLLLLAAGAYAMARFGPNVRQDEVPSMLGAERRLEQLQQSLDAMAIEVERIGENQRFATKVLAEREQARESPKDPSN